MGTHDLVITNRDTADEAICTWGFFKEVNRDAMDDAEFAAIEGVLDTGEPYAEPASAFAGWSVCRLSLDSKKEGELNGNN